MNEKKFIKMRSIAYDSGSFNGSEVYQLFEKDSTIIDKRANVWFEKELVKFLFNPIHRFYKYLIFEELGIDNNYKPYFEVTNPIIDNSNKVPGDIDLLIVNQFYPSQSLGFQVKKLKGFIDIDNINRVKFSNIEEGIFQANEMCKKYKFHKNYLMLIVVNDGMNNTTENFLFRHPKGSEISPLYSVTTYEKLRNEIGIFIIEIIQPLSKGLEKCGVINSKLFKNSISNIQSEEITNKIKLLIDYAK